MGSLSAGQRKKRALSGGKGTQELAPWVKVLDDKSDNMGLIPRAHTMEGGT